MPFFLDPKTKGVKEIGVGSQVSDLSTYSVRIPEAQTYEQAQIYAGQAGGYPVARPITSTDIALSPDIKLSQQTLNTTNYLADILSGQGLLAGYSEAQKTAGATSPAPVSDGYTQLLDYLTTERPPSQADAGASLYGQTQEQIAQEQQTARQEAIRRQAASRAAQAEATAIQAEIQGVIEAGKAKILRLETELKTNAQLGLTTTTAYNRAFEFRQAEINRETAIAALPLQSKALAAQARIATLQGSAEEAQNILNAAQDKLNTVFKYKMEDLQNEYDFRKTQRSEIWDFLKESEKQRIAAIQKKDDRDFTAMQAAINDANAVEARIFTNNPALASEISALPEPKTISEIPVYKQKIAAIEARAVVAEKPVAQSDFEQAFLRDTGRLPTVDELLSYKAREAEAGREPKKEPSEGEQFSSTQINKGAFNAGLSLDDFNTLDRDIKNYFVNLTSTQAFDLRKTLVSVKSGDMDSEDAKEYIKSRGYLSVVEDFLSSLIDTASPPPKDGFWSKVWNGITNLFQ